MVSRQEKMSTSHRSRVRNAAWAASSGFLICCGSTTSSEGADSIYARGALRGNLQGEQTSPSYATGGVVHSPWKLFLSAQFGAKILALKEDGPDLLVVERLHAALLLKSKKINRSDRESFHTSPQHQDRGPSFSFKASIL